MSFDTMSFTARILSACAVVLLVIACAAMPGWGRADEKAAVYSGAACAAGPDGFFASEVWPKVGARTCLECHKAGGDAEDSDFVLTDPARSPDDAGRDAALRHNRTAFAEMARMKVNGEPRMLLKAAGRLKHGGKQVLKPDSAGYGVLAQFVARVNGPPAGATAAGATSGTATAADDGRPFFDGVAMVDDRRLLRRVTLSLAG